MTIVAHSHPFVIGVDTHARTHTLAVLVAATGELVATEQFPATGAGIDRARAVPMANGPPCGSLKASPPTEPTWLRQRSGQAMRSSKRRR
jgi:hypothetical protein